MTPTNNSPFTRRAVLASAGVGAGAAALGGAPAMAQTAQRKTFVLVHGAWREATIGLSGTQPVVSACPAKRQAPSVAPPHRSGL
jgi:hypothetical protein